MLSTFSFIVELKEKYTKIQMYSIDHTLLFHRSILKSMEFRKSKTELTLNISTALETSCLLDTIQLVVLLVEKNKLWMQ